MMTCTVMIPVLDKNLTVTDIAKYLKHENRRVIGDDYRISKLVTDDNNLYLWIKRRNSTCNTYRWAGGFFLDQQYAFDDNFRTLYGFRRGDE